MSTHFKIGVCNDRHLHSPDSKHPRCMACKAAIHKISGIRTGPHAA